MRRTRSSSSPAGTASDSMFVTNPYLYSRFASSSTVWASVFMIASRPFSARSRARAPGETQEPLGPRRDHLREGDPLERLADRGADPEPVPAHGADGLLLAASGARRALRHPD